MDSEARASGQGVREEHDARVLSQSLRQASGTDAILIGGSDERGRRALFELGLHYVSDILAVALRPLHLPHLRIAIHSPGRLHTRPAIRTCTEPNVLLRARPLDKRGRTNASSVSILLWSSGSGVRSEGPSESSKASNETQEDAITRG